ncbi:hypothetical protein [Streptomyces sp. NPDC059452]|uniref:hypothetical protein n=1 Tax=Streptomyces sp. NPDC059452 TaxID=3346835 RepID=UPI0036C5E434
MKLSDVLIIVCVLGAAGGLSVLLGDGWESRAVVPFAAGSLSVFISLRIKERRKRRNAGGWK